MKNTTSKRILSITIKRINDEYPDTSWLGEYSNSPKGDFSIDRKHSLDCQSIKATNEATVEQLQHAIDYLYAIDSDNNGWPSGDTEDAQQLLVDAQESVTECDCDESGNWSRGELQYFNPGSVEKFNPEASWIPASEADIRAYWFRAMQENAQRDYERMESFNNGDWGFVCVAAVAEVQLDSGWIQEITSGYVCGVESDGDYWKEVGQEQLSELRSQLSAIGFSKRAIATAVKNLVESE